MKGREQRRTERIQARFLVEFGPTEPCFPGEVRDVSLHGLFVQTRRQSTVGSLIRLRLYVPDGDTPFDCYAWVRFCDIKRSGGMGLELFAMSYAESTRWGTYYYRCVAAGRKQARAQAAQAHAAVAA
ncbi:MAG TPA: PilZ domain-containing protein [Polyangia bacterium]|nr:PilZ domain-containing protein [Polyangia bacterium]